jgi:AraC-like DNA-binding protein
MLLLPHIFYKHLDTHRLMKLEDCTLIEACVHAAIDCNAAYTAQLELLYLMNGEMHWQWGEQQGQLGSGEAVLIRRGTSFGYEKRRLSSTPYRSILFFLKPTFVTEFLQRQQFSSTNDITTLPFLTFKRDTALKHFIHTLLPYFDMPLGRNPELLRLKVFELLLHLTDANPLTFNFLQQSITLPKDDLTHVMEIHFTKNLPLEEFAFLSGRSLATFKRDFTKTFGTSPARWLKARRLQLARQLLATTAKTVSEISFEVGFEDLSHFSRSFKAQFDTLPTEWRMSRTAQSLSRTA